MGDVPTWLVPHRRDKGRGFVLFRKPHKTAMDPETGELYDDLLVIRTAGAADKPALVEADGPFFTIDHFPRLQRRPRPPVAPRRDHPRRARRGDHRGLAGDRAEVAGPLVPRMSRCGAIDAARLAAYDVLVAVREDDAYANLALPAALREREHPRARRRLHDRAGRRHAARPGQPTTLSSTTLPVAPPTRRPRRPPSRCPPVLAMRVPDHAAVTSTVELVRERVGHKPAGFTNAVMRRIAARDLDAWMAPRRLSAGATLPPGLDRRGARPALDRPEELEALLRPTTSDHG